MLPADRKILPNEDLCILDKVSGVEDNPKFTFADLVNPMSLNSKETNSCWSCTYQTSVVQ